MGLRTRVVTIAGAEADRVVHQQPAAGSTFDADTEVVLRVGVSVDLATVAPDVVGMTQADAVFKLDDLYFLDVRAVKGPASKEGTVLAQDPAAGTEIPFRARVVLEVVRNPRVLPSLLGRTAGEARAALEDLDLVADLVEVEDDVATEDTVIGQLPASGTELMQGSKVTLRVARRPAAEPPAEEPPIVEPPVDPEPLPPTPEPQPVRVVVPELHGLTPFQARALLLLRGLGVRKVQGIAPGAPVNRVYKQHPHAGTLLPRGVRVTYYVPRETTVPVLVAKTKSQALSLLLARGLKAQPIRVGPAMAGTTKVIAQYAPAGQPIARGTKVPFRYKVVPLVVQKPVPNLIGMKRIQAKQALEAAGFEAKMLFVGGVGPKTKVIAQMPAAGTLRPVGSKVTFKYKRTKLGGVIVPLAKVPDVVGMPRVLAKAKLQAAGFDVQTLGAGFKVTNQLPQAGTMKAKGSKVTVKLGV